MARLNRSLDAASQDRLCVHRNDSLYKFMTSSFVASCAEVDVSIDVARATVHAYHPPRADNGLPLLDLLGTAGPRLRRVWLDVKNADPRALELLHRVLAQARQRLPRLAFMVEIEPGMSIQPAQVDALRKLRRLGQVTTAFYLPSKLATLCGPASTPGPCATALAAVDLALEAGQFDGLSFDTSLLTYARQLDHYDRLTRHVWGDLPRPNPRDIEFSTVLVPAETDFDY